ncbi:hypothetical protein Tco_1576526 [Tanacetum coccineum]
MNLQDSSKDSNEKPSKEHLDNLFGPLYEEYYETRSPEVSTNSAVTTLNNEVTSSSSSIIVEDNEAPQIVSSSEEPITNEPTTQVSDDNADESVQEDTTELEGNTFINSFYSPVLEEANSSSTNPDLCNNKKTFPNIPCPKECRIVELILDNHALSHALTANADVLAIYIQQFWRTVKQAPNANETIQFMLDKKHIIYTVDIIHATLKLLVETPEQPFIPLADFDYIWPFMKILRYQGSLDSVSTLFVKNFAQPWQTMFKYPRFTKLIIADIMEKYESIPKRLEEEYHIIKDDAALVNVYTTREVTVRGMQIPNDLLTDAIRDTQAYKDYVEKYEGVVVPTIQPEQVESTQGKDDIIEATKLSLALDKTAKVYEEQQNIAAVEKKILEEDVKKLVEGEDESDEDDFANTILLSDEDSGNRIEPESHKEKLEEIVDDDEKKDDDDKHDDAKDDDDRWSIINQNSEDG